MPNLRCDEQHEWVVQFVPDDDDGPDDGPGLIDGLTGYDGLIVGYDGLIGYDGLELIGRNQHRQSLHRKRRPHDVCYGRLGGGRCGG